VWEHHGLSTTALHGSLVLVADGRWRAASVPPLNRSERGTGGKELRDGAPPPVLDTGLRFLCGATTRRKPSPVPIASQTGQHTRQANRTRGVRSSQTELRDGRFLRVFRIKESSKPQPSLRRCLTAGGPLVGQVPAIDTETVPPSLFFLLMCGSLAFLYHPVTEPVQSLRPQRVTRRRPIRRTRHHERPGSYRRPGQPVTNTRVEAQRKPV